MGKAQKVDHGKVVELEFLEEIIEGVGKHVVRNVRMEERHIDDRRYSTARRSFVRLGVPQHTEKHPEVVKILQSFG